MRFIVLAIVLLVSLSAKAVDLWAKEGFSISALPEFKHLRGNDPAYFRGPAGEMATFNVHDTSELRKRFPREEAVARAIGVARGIFSDAQTHFGGRAEWPTRENVDDNGVTRVTLVSQIHSQKGPGFMLLYAFVSPDGHLAVLVVEGGGMAREQHQKYNNLLATGQWNAR